MQSIEEFLRLTGYPEEVVKKYLKKNDVLYLYCKCGNPRRLLKSLRLGSTCGNRECHHLYGKKRPEHSKKMKELAASGVNERYNNTLMKKGQLKNKNVNTIDFLTKKLTTHGYNTLNKSDEEIIVMNSHYESTKQHSSKNISKKIISFIKKHSLENELGYYTYEELMALSKKDLLRIRFKMNAWHHAIYCASHCGAKSFKKIEKFDLKYNMRKLTFVRTRSKYESNYIDFFEENKILWDYESFCIKLNSWFHSLHL